MNDALYNVTSDVFCVIRDLVCKIINGQMFVSDAGEVRCGSKAGAIAGRCGMLRWVSQSYERNATAARGGKALEPSAGRW